MPTNFGTKILHLYKYSFVFSHGQGFCTTASVRLFYKISGVGIELKLVKAFDRVHWGALWLDLFSLGTFLTAANSPSSPPCHDMMIAALSSQAVRGCGWPVRCIRTGSVNSRGMDSS